MCQAILLYSETKMQCSPLWAPRSRENPSTLGPEPSSPLQMAATGFVHCPTENEPDLAQCFFCFKELEGWETKLQREPTISRKNLKKLQRKSTVPLSSWLPRSDATHRHCPTETQTHHFDFPVKTIYLPILKIHVYLLCFKTSIVKNTAA
uniref:Baculoviral IAP repeat-containing protein 5 n=1 Tax=Monodon monoceros TaxID=40151 RepID=A0A8C6CBE3_MONMO